MKRPAAPRRSVLLAVAALIITATVRPASVADSYQGLPNLSPNAGHNSGLPRAYGTNFQTPNDPYGQGFRDREHRTRVAAAVPPDPPHPVHGVLEDRRPAVTGAVSQTSLRPDAFRVSQGAKQVLDGHLRDGAWCRWTR
jgi:hypothetical protein